MKQDIKRVSNEFEDKIRVYRYYFETYALKYLNNYIAIVKNKSLMLLNIIKNRWKQYWIILSLDINLDENGNILW